MLTKRKATKKSLDELRKIMPVLSENEQRGRIGGHDCWWRVMAYLQSGGTNYTGPWDAWHVARDYKGYAFDPTNFAFSGSEQQHRDTARSILSGTGATGSILVFNEYGNGTGMWHAVVIRSDGFCPDRGTFAYVYCPQTTGSFRVYQYDTSGSRTPLFRINVRG